MKQIIVRRTGNIEEVLFSQLLYNSQEISGVLRDVNTTNILGVKTHLTVSTDHNNTKPPPDTEWQQFKNSERFLKTFEISKYKDIQDLSRTKNQGQVSNLHFTLPKCMTNYITNNKFNGSKEQTKKSSLSTDQQHWKPIIHKWKEQSYFLKTMVVSK